MIIEIIICVIIFILVIPIKINLAIYLNLLKNKGALFIRFWNFLTIIQEKFYIADGEVTSKNNHNKEKTIQLSKEDKDIIFLQIFCNSYIRKIILDAIDFFFDMGKKDDAFIATIGTSVVQVFANIILSILKTKKYGFKSGVYCNSLFLTNKLTTILYVGCWTNVFDLVFTFLKSKLKTNKRVREINAEKQRA